MNTCNAVVAAVVVTVNEAYNLYDDGRTNGLVRVNVVVKAAAVVDGVIADTAISVYNWALVPSQIQMPTKFAAVAAVIDVEQAFTIILSILQPFVVVFNN